MRDMEWGVHMLVSRTASWPIGLALLLLTILGPLPGTCGESDIRPTFTPVEWQKSFVRSTGSDGSLEHGLRSLGVQSYSPFSSLMAVTASRGWYTKPRVELWTAQPSGEDAHRVATSTGDVLAVEWSPDGKTLACVSLPSFYTHRADQTSLFVIERKSGRVTLIAKDGAVAPRWTMDGKYLLFLKRESERWKPYRASEFSRGPKLEAVSDLALDQPGAFSRDGLRVAGVKAGKLVTEMLASHVRTESDFGAKLMALEWSGDGQWIVLQSSHAETFLQGWGSWPDPTFSALQPATGKVLPLGPGLGLQAAPEQGEAVYTPAASWVPGAGHRLLLRGERARFLRGDVLLAGDPEPGVLERRWLMFDVDSGKARPVENLASVTDGFGSGYAFIIWSPDGRYVSIGPRHGGGEVKEYRVMGG